MGRIVKRGLDYFPLDVDIYENIKYRKIKRACGHGAMEILIALLSNIYRDKGYYALWDNDMPFLISDNLGISEGAVEEFVAKCVQVEFFDADIYATYNVLTSKRIQRTYIRAASERKEIEIIEAIWLIDVPEDNKKTVYRINTVDNDIYRPINPINPPTNPQRKEKESKEKKSNKNILSGSPVEKPQPSAPTTHVQIIDYLNNVCGTAFKANSKATQTHINARLNEGYSLDDFIAVIDKKHAEWHNKPDMAQYLRPQTLFGTKFEGYLNQPAIVADGLKPVRKTKFTNIESHERDYAEIERMEQEYLMQRLEGG